MAGRHRLTTVETVREERSWLFTARDEFGDDREVILVPCDDEVPVEAWINRCTHDAQKLHRGDVGAVFRDGEIVCPRHGSTFDSCSGYCDNGEAADTTLLTVEIEVENGQVYLTDEDFTFMYEGPVADDDGGDGPGSTSHIQF